MNLELAIQTAARGERLNFLASKLLYESADFLTLGQLAHGARFRHNPEPVVTYAVDRNINYTNICVSGCRFCAFYRGATHSEAYVLDEATLIKKLEETKSLGGTHILFQGGLHPGLTLAWHEKTIRLIRSLGLYLHGYSPPEIWFLAQQYDLTVEKLLQVFIKAGLSSIPGGGAEVLCDRVRKVVSPGKVNSRQWLEVMATAHRLGLKTTATMMFGHVETTAERLTHLFRLRRLQDQTGGFTAFIPWPYQPGRETLPARKVEGVGYLRVLAISRLVLDNFPHIQASWVTQGPRVGQTALFFGADDLGSTMIEENVVAAAGVSHRLSQAQMLHLIESAGFLSRQRNAIYGAV